ncbi:proteoglycan 4-like isoform X2 [Scylla paramamosain]|uniref:proteoglycan 4-like isoform X2 n=1 Tax=Scylla paramamosain TaxID=85552 RepID=UPI0030827057
MARLALLSSVILLLLGVTLAAEDSPPLDPDPDPYQVAASRSEIVVARQLLDPQATTEGATGKLQGRRRRLGARRRRPLDPERRRQLLLRRQQLGLPLRRRLRPLQEGKSPSTTTTTGPTTITTTTQAPLTSTSTSSSFSSSSVSSSSSSSTTLRSVFPSFSLASRLRAGADRRPSWGSKTPSEETRKKEEEEESEEEKEEPEPKDLAELTSPGDLKERRRGVSKILNRPVHRRLTPTLAPTLVTTPTTARRDREERLRFRPLLSGKRVRVGRRKNTPRPRPTVTSSTTTATIPTTTATTTTTTTTAAPTSSLPPPPTTTTDAPFVHHRDSPDFWQDSSTTLHIDSSTPHPEVSIFDQDSLAFLQDPPVVFQPDSPSFDYDYDSPTIPPDSSVFGPDVFPPPPPTFLPAPRSAPLPSKPRHTPVPKKVNIAPQPSWPRHPKFLPIRRFKPEAQDVKSIVPKPKYVPLDSRPSLPSFTPPPSPSPVTRQGDHVVNEDSNRFVTHRPRHFEPALSLIRDQDGFEEEGQGHLDVFPSHVAKQNGFEIPERSRFDPFSSFVSQESISQPKPDHFDAFPSLVAQVTPQPNFVTRERNFIPENPNFLNQNPNYEPDREVLQSAFTPRPREHFREPPARTTTDHTAARHTGFLQTRRHSTPRPHPLLHDSELVYAPQADFDEAADPLYHTEVIYTPDQGDGGYDEADAPVYEDEDIQLESDYEEDYKEPGVLDHYKYGYQVDSEDTGNFQQRYEARDGATVSGSYKSMVRCLAEETTTDPGQDCKAR